MKDGIGDELEKRRPKEIEDKTRVKQCRGMSSGVYIKGLVEDVPIIFTADTGASRTVISTKVYNKIAVEKQPKLESSSCLVGAGGLPIQECGKGHFVIRLGMHSRSIEAVVADIEDEALLGYDVLEGGSQGADILLSQNKIILDGIEIPCFQVGRSHTIKRVVMADDAQIPGRTEALVDVYVERNEGDDHDQNGKYIIEPTEQFVGRYHILMASVLVDINASTTCKVRVLNPFSHTVTLRQDAEVGRAEKIELVLNTIAERENPNELVNFN